MAIDARKNFAKANVSTGYDAAATSVVLATGGGAKFPAAPFNATWWNLTDYPDPSDDPNVEIVRVTAIATDTITIVRGQETTSASTKNTGGKTYRLQAGVTKKMIDDIETGLNAAGSNISASSVAYAATVTPAISTKDTTILNVGALTGAITIANPTGSPAEGQRLVFRFLQDATGGRVITWGSNLVFGSDIPASLMPTDANAAWEVVFQYNTTATKYRCVGIARGF